MSRPYTAAAITGTAAHHAFELSAGVGLVWQPELGLPGALALWGAVLPAGFVQAARRDEAWEPDPPTFGKFGRLFRPQSRKVSWGWPLRTA